MRRTQTQIGRNGQPVTTRVPRGRVQEFGWTPGPQTLVQRIKRNLVG